jgi:hypothetical protein
MMYGSDLGFMYAISTSSEETWKGNSGAYLCSLFDMFKSTLRILFCLLKKSNMVNDVPGNDDF